MSEGITKDGLLTTFPTVLANNETMHALAVASAKILANRLEEIERVRIYTALENLPEELLDSLAYDFKIDWWDYDYSKEQKLQILKTNWAVHRHMGTKSAVETAIRSIFADSSITEWFEFEGKPYTFRVLIDISDKDANEEIYNSVMERVWFYKNLRSHLGGIIYTLRPQTADLYCAADRFKEHLYMLCKISYDPSIPPINTETEIYCAAAVCGYYMRAIVNVSYHFATDEITASVEVYCAAIMRTEHMYVTTTVPIEYPIYDGETTIVPKIVDQELQTKNTVVMGDITVKEIPVSDVSNTSGGITITIG